MELNRVQRGLPVGEGEGGDDTLMRVISITDDSVGLKGKCIS